MPRLSPHDLDAAKRLFAHELSLGKADQPAIAAGRVYDKLSWTLAPIIGAAGVRALFVRAVRLSRPEFPCLEAILTAAGPSEDLGQRLVECLSELDAGAALEVATGVYAALLGLMTEFIGERMVWQILRSAFSDIDMTGSKENER